MSVDVDIDRRRRRCTVDEARVGPIETPFAVMWPKLPNPRDDMVTCSHLTSEVGLRAWQDASSRVGKAR